MRELRVRDPGRALDRGAPVTHWSGKVVIVLAYSAK
jgi:hypothetical protein